MDLNAADAGTTIDDDPQDTADNALEVARGLIGQWNDDEIHDKLAAFEEAVEMLDRLDRMASLFGVIPTEWATRVQDREAYTAGQDREGYSTDPAPVLVWESAGTRYAEEQVTPSRTVRPGGRWEISRGGDVWSVDLIDAEGVYSAGWFEPSEADAKLSVEDAERRGTAYPDND